MRYKVTISGKKEDIFNYCLNELDSHFYASKEMHLEDLERVKGTIFQVPVTVGGKVDKSRVASIKITEYQFPDKFAFEYSSSTYHKISEFEIQQESEGKCTLLTHTVDEQLRDGKVIKTGNESDTYKSNFLVSHQLRSGFKAYMSNLSKKK